MPSFINLEGKLNELPEKGTLIRHAERNNVSDSAIFFKNRLPSLRMARSPLSFSSRSFNLLVQKKTRHSG